MPDLLTELKKLQNSKIQKLIRSRITDFKSVGREDDARWFSELCFCILTANSSAKLCMEIQEELGPDGFLELLQRDLTQRLKELGHRFYRTRAEYIVEARRYSGELKDIILKFSDSWKAREWLVENVKGIGYKEGSHFLRNVGFFNVMILDHHILRTIDNWELIEMIPKTLTRKRYLEIEKKLESLAEKARLNLAELDLYLWHMATGKVLK